MQYDLGLVKGNGIVSIEKTGTSGLVDTYTVTYDNGDTDTFDVTNGEDGSIVEVTQVLSSGTKLATITVDGISTDLYCSAGGSADIVTSWEQVLSDLKVPSEKLTKNSLDTKISKSNTTGLVKNDGTIDTTSYVSDVSGKADKTGWTASKNIVTDSSGALTTENKNNHTHGSLNSDGSLGSGSGLSGHIVVLDNNNKLSETSSINASKIKDSNAHSNIGTSANATQSQINSAIDSLIGSAITYIVGSGS